MKRSLYSPEVIAAIITVVGTFLVSVILSYIEGQIGFAAVVATLAVLLLVLLLIFLYMRTGPRVTAGAAAVMLIAGFVVFLAFGRRWQRRVLSSTPTTNATATITTSGLATATATSMPLETPRLPVTTTPQVPVTPTPSAEGIRSPTPTSPPEPQVTPMPVQKYTLPLTGPQDIAYDGSALRVLFESRLVKLELVEGEGRFRAVEHQDFPPANSLAWDASRGAYWAVCGAPRRVREEIDLIDQGGNKAASFTIPQTFVGRPRFIAWDGEYLWVTSNDGPLYKLQPVGDSGELREIDSYAPGIDRHGRDEASGLTWDGNHLWLLVGDVVSKLNQAAQSICRIELPFGFPQPSWWGWRGLDWDGQFLWVAHQETSKVYRVDPYTCR